MLKISIHYHCKVYVCICYVMFFPITITTKISDKSRVASLSCINKIIWRIESLIGNDLENVHIFI